MGRHKKIRPEEAVKEIRGTASGSVIEKIETDPTAQKKEQASKLRALESELATEATPEKPTGGSGYKKKALLEEEAKRQAYVESLKSDFSQFSGLILDIIAARLPNPEPIKPMEREMFSSATGRMIEKYYPKLNGLDVELTFALAALVVLVPRVRKKKTKPPIVDTPVQKVWTEEEMKAALLTEDEIQAAQSERIPATVL